MASYQGHLMCSSVLGAGYGALGVWQGHFDWGAGFLGAGLTAIGGMVPDLDSGSGRPLRELSSLAAAIVPVLTFQRLHEKLSHEQTLAVMAGIYLFVRYGLAHCFKSWSVHRGMFHSAPAMLISGLIVFLLYHCPEHHESHGHGLEHYQRIRLYLAGAMMLGFLSHLLLDELYSVDLRGFRISLNRYAGSAFKLASKSYGATLATYVVLGFLAYLAYLDF